MTGFLVFQHIYYNLEDECQNKVLGNIFDVTDVSVSDVFIFNNKIIFKMFSNGIFYNYAFILDYGDNRFMSSDNIVDYTIFVFNDDFKKFNDFIYRIFSCQNENQVYLLMKEFL